MSMTMTQKILAAHATGRARAGELIMAKLDLVLGNDITAPVAIREFPKFGRAEVFDKEKVALVPDHFTPNKDIKAAQQCAAMRAFAREQGIVNYFEVGHDCGIEHALLPEKGLVTAGDLVIGADSHTCMAARPRRGQGRAARQTTEMGERKGRHSPSDRPHRR